MSELKTSRDELRQDYKEWKVLDKVGMEHISGNKTNPNRPDQTARVKRVLESELQKAQSIENSAKFLAENVQKELEKVRKESV